MTASLAATLRPGLAEVRGLTASASKLFESATARSTVEGMFTEWPKLKALVGEAAVGVSKLSDEASAMSHSALPSSDAALGAMVHHADIRFGRVSELLGQLDNSIPRFEHLIGSKGQAAERLQWLHREMDSGARLLDDVGSSSHKLFAAREEVVGLRGVADDLTRASHFEAVAARAQKTVDQLDDQIRIIRDELKHVGDEGIEAMTVNDGLPYRAVGLNAARQDMIAVKTSFDDLAVKFREAGSDEARAQIVDSASSLVSRKAGVAEKWLVLAAEGRPHDYGTFKAGTVPRDFLRKLAGG